MIQLSILIPAVFDRQSWDLYNYLRADIAGRPVEVLALFDDKHRSLGAKRNALMSIAQGEYITHLDDDDWFLHGYTDAVLGAIAANAGVDLIAYNNHSSLNGSPVFEVSTGLDYPNEQAHMVDGQWAAIKRKPWLWCCWRRELVKSVLFPDKTCGEDWGWLDQVLPLVESCVKIEKVLHVYKYSNKSSVADGRP